MSPLQSPLGRGDGTLVQYPPLWPPFRGRLRALISAIEASHDGYNTKGSYRGPQGAFFQAFLGNPHRNLLRGPITNSYYEAPLEDPEEPGECHKAFLETLVFIQLFRRNLFRRVTRFGEILPLFTKCQSLWDLFDGY